jgi:hypothetical protein
MTEAANPLLETHFRPFFTPDSIHHLVQREGGDIFTVYLNNNIPGPHPGLVRRRAIKRSNNYR